MATPIATQSYVIADDQVPAIDLQAASDARGYRPLPPKQQAHAEIAVCSS